MSRSSSSLSSFDLYQTVTDQIVAMLDQGVVPWRSPVRTSVRPVSLPRQVVGGLSDQLRQRQTLSRRQRLPARRHRVGQRL